MATTKRLDLILGARDQASGAIGKVTGSVAGLAGKLVALAGIGLSAAAVVGFAKQSVAAFFEQEKAVANLTAALRLAGDGSAAAVKEISDLASSIQAVTTKGDESTMMLASYIATLGELTGEALKGATTATLGLARATGQGEQMMARAYLNALQGNFSMLERYVPAIRAATTAQEKMALVQGLAAKGFEMLEADAQTSAGAIQQMKNTYGDFLELIGERIAPILAGAAGRVKVFVEQNGAWIAGLVGRVISGVGALGQVVLPKLQALGAWVMGWVQRIGEFVLPTVLAWGGYVRSMIGMVVDMVSSGFSAIIGLVQPLLGSVGGIGSTLERVRDVAMGALITLQFGFENWRAVVASATDYVMFAVVRLANQVHYFFGEVVPGVLMWLKDNWRDILRDIAVSTQTIFTNLVKNAVATIKNLPQLISGEMSIGDIWGDGLLAGFESKLKDLPKIAARQEGELERQLREQFEDSNEGLRDGLDEFTKRRLAEIEEQERKLREFFGGGGGAPPPEPIDPASLIEGGVTVPVTVEEDGSVSVEPPAGGSRRRERSGVAAVEITRQFLGIAGLISGGAASPESETAANTKEAAAEAKKQTTWLKKIAEKIENAGGPVATKRLALKGGR